MSRCLAVITSSMPLLSFLLYQNSAATTELNVLDFAPLRLSNTSGLSKLRSIES